MNNWSELIKRMGKVRLLGLVGLVILVIIIGVATVGLGKGGFDVGSRAWTGFVTNVDNLRVQFGGDSRQGGVVSVDEAGFRETKELFMNLTKTYFDAEYQNIDIPEFGIKGAAFLKYDEGLDKTFIFASVENFPIPNKQTIRLWITRDNQVYLPVGVMDYVVEKAKFEGYSVFVRPGDIRNYKEMVISYDPIEKVNKPVRPVLSVLF